MLALQAINQGSFSFLKYHIPMKDMFCVDLGCFYFIMLLIGMSPSRTSPLEGQNDQEVNAKERDHQSPGVIGIHTPPVPNITLLDPDDRNPRTGGMYF